jgi:hypothetical protein
MCFSVVMLSKIRGAVTSDLGLGQVVQSDHLEFRERLGVLRGDPAYKVIAFWIRESVRMDRKQVWR